MQYSYFPHTDQAARGRENISRGSDDGDPKLEDPLRGRAIRRGSRISTLGARHPIADPTRRSMIETLRRGEESVSSLAQPHAMTLSGAFRHIRVLQRAGLVIRRKRGRTVWCTLNPTPLRRVMTWVSRYEKFWDEQLGLLAEHIADERKE